MTVHDTGSAAINYFLNPGIAFEVEEVKLKLNGAGGAGNLTLNVESVKGSNYNVALRTTDMTSVTNYHFLPERPVKFAKGDQFKVSWANANTKTYGLQINFKVTRD